MTLEKKDRSTEAASSGRLGILLIDHGSRKASSNDQLEALAARLSELVSRDGAGPWVDFAHMEIASPPIATGFGRCVAAGATRIVAVPCFLSRGRHVTEDIPKLLAEAAEVYPDVPYVLAPPLSEHEGFLGLLRDAAFAHAPR